MNQRIATYRDGGKENDDESTSPDAGDGGSGLGAQEHDFMCQRITENLLG
jgi:hypothetical protein